jgi:DNA replication protein DnaC
VAAPKSVPPPPPPEPFARTLANIAKHARPANEVSQRNDRVRHRAQLARAERRGVATAGPVWETVFPEGRAAWTEAMACLDLAFAERRALVVLSGAAGTGKSVALARAVLASHNPALLVHAATLGAALTAPGHDVDRRDLADRAVEVPTLAIDDLGLEHGDDATHAIVAALCRRVDAGRTTAITTHLDVDAFRARYLDREAGRLASRFAAAGVWYPLASDDLRRNPPPRPSPR